MEGRRILQFRGDLGDLPFEGHAALRREMFHRVGAQGRRVVAEVGVEGLARRKDVLGFDDCLRAAACRFISDTKRSRSNTSCDSVGQ